MHARSLTCTLLLALLASQAGSGEMPPEASREVLEAVLRDKYFTLGSWRLGMRKEEALTHFANVMAVEGDRIYRGVAQTHFAADRPAQLTFSRGRLQSVKLTVYEGTDFDQATRKMQEALLFMDANFVGANFEGGLKTSMDRDGELLRTVLSQSIERTESGARFADEEQGKTGSTQAGFTAFELVLNFWTERIANNNFLLGEFRYRSDTQTLSVCIYDDRKFVESRVPKASVMLFKASGERPARESLRKPAEPAP